MSTTAELELQEVDSGPKPLSPVTLRTRRDHSLVVQAIEHRLDGLGKLSKKATEEGYPSLARTVDADSAALRELVLPQFREQQELALATTGDVVASVEAFFASVTNEVPGNVKGEARDHEIIRACARRTAQALTKAAERGYWAGESAREHVPELMAVRAIEDAKRKRQGEAEG